MRLEILTTKYFFTKVRLKVLRTFFGDIKCGLSEWITKVGLREYMSSERMSNIEVTKLKLPYL